MLGATTSALAFVVTAASLGGCSSNNASEDASPGPDTTDTPTTVASPAVTDSPPASGAITVSASGSVVATASGLPTALASGAITPPPPVPSATPTIPVSFTDLSGVPRQAIITAIAGLDVFDPTPSEFRPNDPVKRRDFVRWLVRANNAIWANVPGKLVKLARPSEVSSYADMSVEDPDFPYVQGMQDAGYPVGLPDTAFRPDQPLTREQAFGIKDEFDRGGIDRRFFGNLDAARAMLPNWKDKDDIANEYVAAIATGAGDAAANFARVYGSSTSFLPQTPVTRGEAALLISTIGDHVLASTGDRSVVGAP